MELTVGEIYEGKVKSITGFGAFIALPENRTGMVHISEVAYAYVSDIHQYLTEGQDVRVMVTAIDPNGKISLSIKKTQPRPERTPSQTNRSFNRTDNRAPRREQTSAPQQSSSAPPVYTPAPSRDQSFEDKLKQFMTQSESRLADAKQYEYKTKPRRRS